MSIFDLSLILILIGFTVNGLFKGIIKMIGAIVAFFLAIYVATRLYLPFYNWGSNYISGSENVLKIVAFILILLITSKLVQIAFNIIEKIFKLAAFIPGSRLINNILGGVFGLLLGSLLLGSIIYFMGKYLDIGGTVSNLIVSSQVAPILLVISKIVLPILPASLKSLISLI